MHKTYSEKEISVFNGVLSLFKEGKKIYNITVQEIADAADMGKGTLYEYFPSKEEIIVNAMLYFVQQENLAVQDIMAADSSFKDKILALYDLTAQSFKNGFPLISQFAANGEGFDIPKLIDSHREKIVSVIEFRTKLIAEILEKGRSEGLICTDFDKEYIAMAVKANLAALNSCQQLPQCNISVWQFEQKKEMAYTLLLKSLN